METLLHIANKVMTGISLVTALGVFVHDGRVDKAAATIAQQPVDSIVATDTSTTQRVRAFIETDAHAHSDYNAVRATMLSNFSYQSPSVAPRHDDYKRHLLRELRARGHHAFDNALLPVVS